MELEVVQTRPDKYFMKKALRQAQRAFENDEVPIGAVVVHGDTVVGRGFNRIEKDQDATAHAEVIAIGKAAKKVGSWRLHECTLFVTLEPCMMCLGASLQSRVKRIVYGATDSRFGAVSTRTYQDTAEEAYRRWPEVEHGILGDECKEIIQRFFKKIRKEAKERKKLLKAEEAAKQADLNKE